MTGLLNVADIAPRSTVNGPGIRTVVWVQGCTLACNGCFNPHTHPHLGQALHDPAELATRIADRASTTGPGRPSLEGITISGGEPFQQAAACATLAETAQSKGLSVVVFTGYPYTHLSRSPLPEVRRLLSATDLLVAGPYVPRLATSGDHPLLASSNQTLQHLTNRYGPADLTPAPRPDRSAANKPLIDVCTDGRSVHATGFVGDGDLDWLTHEVAAALG